MSLSSHSAAFSSSMFYSLSDEIVPSESQTYLTFIIPSIAENIYLCDKGKIVFCREYSNIVYYPIFPLITRALSIQKCSVNGKKEVARYAM
jgi:hypothetical protein